MSTFKAKLNVLKGVQEQKYPLPKNFPTLEELNSRNNEMQSTHYKKTAIRRKEIDAKRDRIQDKFIDDKLEIMPTFRKTTRDYHV